MTTEFERNTTTAERAIVRKLIDEILAAGYVVSVNDGEEWTVNKSDDKAEIIAALASTGYDVIAAQEHDKAFTFVLIWGNDEDVISDHTDIPEACRLADLAQQAVAS